MGGYISGPRFRSFQDLPTHFGCGCCVGRPRTWLFYLRTGGRSGGRCRVHVAGGEIDHAAPAAAPELLVEHLRQRDASLGAVVVDRHDAAHACHAASAVEQTARTVAVERPLYRLRSFAGFFHKDQPNWIGPFSSRYCCSALLLNISKSFPMKSK
jgi:hypothetical protein